METIDIPVVHENYPSGHLLNTSWCLVTFVLLEAGSAVNWSITRKRGAIRIKWGAILEISTKKPKHYPHQKPAPTRRSSGQHWNKGDPSWQSRLFERGAKRLLTIAFFSQIWLSLSTAVEKSSWPDLTGFSSLAPRHKDVAMTWMHINGEIILYVMKINSQGYPWGRLFWKLSSAPHIQRSPHQLQIPIHTVQWKWPGNTPDNQQALQMNHSPKSNNPMMPSSGYSAHVKN